MIACAALTTVMRVSISFLRERLPLPHSPNTLPIKFGLSKASNAPARGQAMRVKAVLAQSLSSRLNRMKECKTG